MVRRLREEWKLRLQVLQFSRLLGVAKRHSPLSMGTLPLLQRKVEQQTAAASGALEKNPLRAAGARLEAVRLHTIHTPITCWRMPIARDFRTGRHVIYHLHVHLVFVTKYRRGALTPALHSVVRETAAAVCHDFESELLEYGGEDDHVHLLVSYPPKVAVSRLVNSLKGVTSRRLRKEHGGEIRKKPWGTAFWSPSYCAVSTRGAALDTVRAYIERQRHRTTTAR